MERATDWVRGVTATAPILQHRPPAGQGPPRRTGALAAAGPAVPRDPALAQGAPDRVGARVEVVHLPVADRDAVQLRELLERVEVLLVLEPRGLAGRVAAERAWPRGHLRRVGQVGDLEVGPPPVEGPADVLGVGVPLHQVAQAEAVRDELDDRLEPE